MIGSQANRAVATPTARSDAPAVLYIAGPGRSGSTLLDLVLGQVDGVVSVGELRNLWSRGFDDAWPCGCGLAVLECPFWSAVLQRAFGPLESFSSESVRVLQAATSRTRHLPKLWWETSHSPSPATRRYAAVLDALYQAIAAVSGARVVVDSSKHPSDAIVASTLEQIDLFVLHLVRDPRAVAFSWSRPKKSAREAIELETQSRLFCSTRWSLWNSTIDAVLPRRVGDRYRLVRYEDLMEDPARVLGDVLDFVGLPRTGISLSDGKLTLHPTHSVCGNPSRFSTGEVALVPDERWKSEMGTVGRFIATLPALPVMGRYGYRFAVGSGPANPGRS